MIFEFRDLDTGETKVADAPTSNAILDWAYRFVATNLAGEQHWYKDSKFHREDGPAVIDADGTKYWYLNGRGHREDGPAVICADGSKHWWLNGERHREDSCY